MMSRRPEQAVLVLSCLTDPQSKMHTLGLGADDYVSKPFHVGELVARVQARLRAASRPGPAVLAYGRLRLDVLHRQADAGAGPVSLTSRECQLLWELMRQPGKVVPKEDLLARVWGSDPDCASNVIDVYVRRLRAQLGTTLITTVRAERVTVLLAAERAPLVKRLWASRWPEVAWAVFATGNLVWMVLMPSWSMLPYHFSWISLLLLYGLGMRTWSRRLTWCLVLPVMTATGLLFVDPAIRGLQPYDELVELPMMVVMLYVMSRFTSRRSAAMAELDNLTRRNTTLLERQRAFVQNASHELRTPITVALAHAELLADVARGLGLRSGHCRR